MDSEPPQMLEPNNEDSSYDAQDAQEEEEMYTRGRSRSRSMHASDAIPVIDPNNTTPEQKSVPTHKSDGSGGRVEKPIDRNGPLQLREVAALKKVRCFLFTIL
jgi:hypothetical protein